jgi:hypothetical protein
MTYYTNDNFISFSEKPRKAVSKESFASIEEPIFTHFIVGDVKNVFFRNNRRRSTSAFAGDNEMRKKINENWSMDSGSADIHQNGSQYSIASKKSAVLKHNSGQGVKIVQKVAKDKKCVVKANEIAVLTTEQPWDYETYLISGFMRLKGILGRGPELVDLYNAGFTQEEIDLMENLTDGWLTEEATENEFLQKNGEQHVSRGTN